MRIGILKCDSVAPEFQATFGDYPDMFRDLLSHTIAQGSFRDYDLTAGDFPGSLQECDAWLITGSKWSVYDQDDWIAQAHELARQLHRQRRPTVGICFGHQLMASALGGRVEQAGVGWGVGVHKAQILARRAWMVPTRDALPLLVSHEDQVIEPPEEASILAGHDFCPVDMMQIGDHILTLQGHPEFPVGYSRALMKKRREQLGEALFREGVGSLEQPVESAAAANWISRFLMAACQERAD